MISRINVPLDDPLPRELRQSASHCCSGTDIQKKERLGRKGLPYFLRIPDLYDDVEIDKRLDERHLQFFKLPHPFKCGKQLHGLRFLIGATSYADLAPPLPQVEMGAKLACIYAGYPTRREGVLATFSIGLVRARNSEAQMSNEPIPRGRAMSSATLYATGYDENRALQAGARHGLFMADQRRSFRHKPRACGGTTAERLPAASRGEIASPHRHSVRSAVMPRAPHPHPDQAAASKLAGR